MGDHTRRDKFDRQLGALKTEFSTFRSQYQSLARFMAPRRGRFHQNERNRGGQHFWNEIINSQATYALRVATAGMFNGIMSPSRPWLLLGTDDPDISKFGPAKEWFFAVQQRMQRMFNESNLYSMAPVMIREQLLFGTGCMSHVDDLDDIARFYSHTVGSYYIAQNDKFIVDTVGREMDRTVGQIVAQFSTRGRVSPKISEAVRRQYDLGNYHAWYPLVQFVEPNEEFRKGSLRPTQRKFMSTWYEPGNRDKDKFLAEKGFEEFPYYAPRWALTNEDVYATECPGMIALGDTRQLQLQEKRKAQGIDKTVAPPLHGPALLKNQLVSQLPAGGTFYDAPGQSNILKPIYEVRLNLADLTNDMAKVEGRINQAFFTDLFLAISSMEGVQPRNQLELMQRKQESLLQLGPVLEREYGDFLDPMVSRGFNQLVRAGEIPPPPEVLQGRPLNPRYISALAMAQQAVSTGNIERFLTFVAGLVPTFPSVVDKVNSDMAAERYADLIGLDPNLIVAQDIVDQRRAAQRQEQEQAQAAEMEQQMAQTMQTAGATDLGDGETLAGRVVSQIGGEE